MTTSPEMPRARARARTALLILAASLIAAAPVVLAAPAQAEETVGISARPAGADGSADGRSRFSYKVDPGQRLEDNFLVANTGTAEQAFTVVGTDAFNDDAGDIALLATDEEPTAIGRLVHFENGANRIEFTLQPGESRVLPFSLELPADATPGDHVGGLVASVVTLGEQVNTDRRVATGIYARVSGQLQPRLNIASIDASYHGDWWNLFSGAVTVRYTVDNPGNIALAGNAIGNVSTWFGIPVASASGGSIKELLPGNSATYEVVVNGIGQLGYLNAAVVLHPFVDSPDAAAQLPASPVSRDTITVAIPWLVLLVLALLAGAFALRAWRRRADAKRAEAWITYTEAEAKRKAEAELVGAGAGPSQ